MQTSFFEIGVQYGPPACGRRSILDPNFSEFGSHLPMRPRQTRRIPSFQQLSLIHILFVTRKLFYKHFKRMNCHSCREQMAITPRNGTDLGTLQPSQFFNNINSFFQIGICIFLEQNFLTTYNSCCSPNSSHPTLVTQ